MVGSVVLQGIQALDADQPGPYSTVQYSVLPGPYSVGVSFPLKSTRQLAMTLIFHPLGSTRICQQSGGYPRLKESRRLRDVETFQNCNQSTGTHLSLSC